MGCPGENTIVRHAAGELTSEVAEQIEAHIDGCPVCAELVAVAARDAGGSGETSIVYDTGSGDRWNREHDLVDPVSIGRYVVIGTIGAGGMGTVYAAFDPRLQRKVAVKVLRPEVARGDAAIRMRREAMALASLAHPNVVEVFEVGTVRDTGGPDADGPIFIVMEMVDGTDLRVWLRSVRSDEQILDAFVQAGRGLAAAHAAGLVHRDFKPDNVLVGRDGRVRITDFGLVRAVGSASSDLDTHASVRISDLDTRLTVPGTVAGTYGYMAPEQKAGGEVNERSDQFSYCVSLWEALSGQRPGPVASGRERPAGSERIMARLRPVLTRGLAKRPADRWPDMDRLLDAMTGTRRRYGGRRVLTAVVAGLGLLAVGVFGTMESDEPVTRESAAPPPTPPAAEEQAALASLRADIDEARALLDRGDRDAAIERLDDVIARARELEDRSVLAEALQTQGLYIKGGGDYPRANETLIEAYHLAESQGLDVLAADVAISLVLSYGTDQGNAKVGRQWVRHAESVIDRLEGGVRRVKENDLWAARGNLLLNDGRPAQAKKDFDRVLERSQELYGPVHDEVLMTHNDLGNALVDLGEFDAAVEHYERGLAQARKLYGEDHDRVALLTGNIGVAFARRDMYPEAAPHFRTALEIYERVFGERHPEVARSSFNLGLAEHAAGNDEAARQALERAHELWSEALGAGHPKVGRPLDYLADLALQDGQHAQAEAYYQRSLVIYESAQGPEHTDCAIPLRGLARVARARGEPERAVQLLERATRIVEQADVADDMTAAVRFELARATWAARRRADAVALAEAALQSSKRGGPSTAEQTAEIEAWLARHEA